MTEKENQNKVEPVEIKPAGKVEGTQVVIKNNQEVTTKEIVQKKSD